MSKVLCCKDCGWKETELSPSGYASAHYHEQLYNHKVELKNINERRKVYK